MTERDPLRGGLRPLTSISKKKRPTTRFAKQKRQESHQGQVTTYDFTTFDF